MKHLIARPVVIAGAGGMRSFAPGLTVEVDVDVPTAQQILAQQAGIAAEPTPITPATSAPRHRKSVDAET